MFNNSGKKIREIAENNHFLNCFMFFVLGVLLILVGVALLNNDINKQTNILGLVLLFLGIVLPIILIVSSYRKYLYYAAFGELVERTTECSEHLKDIKKLLENAKVDEPRTPNVPDSEA